MLAVLGALFLFYVLALAVVLVLGAVLGALLVGVTGLGWLVSVLRARRRTRSEVPPQSADDDMQYRTLIVLASDNGRRLDAFAGGDVPDKQTIGRN